MTTTIGPNHPASTTSNLTSPPLTPYTSAASNPQPQTSSTTTPTTPTTTSQRTLSPLWTYFHLQPLYSTTFTSSTSILKPLPSTSPSPFPSLDATTLRLSLLSALSNYLGLHGSAIPLDILHIINPSPSPGPGAETIHTLSTPPTAIIRVPVQDGDAVAAAIASYATGGVIGGATGGIQGYRIRGRSEWLAGLVATATAVDGGRGSGDMNGQGLFDFAA